MMVLFTLSGLPSIIHPRAGSQVWWRCQCGSALSAQAARTWSKQSPVKHHVQQRWYPLLSQIFLCFPQIPPFLLLHRVLGELSRFCRSVSSLPGGSLCGHVYGLETVDMWRFSQKWHARLQQTCESNQWMVKGEDFTPRPLLWFAALKRQVLSPVEQWNVTVCNVTTPFTVHLYATEPAW